MFTGRYVQVNRTAARELHALRTLHHPNLVSFLESFHAHGQLHLVFELMDRSLLADLEANPEGLPSTAVQSNMLQLVLAVQFMHDNQVSKPPTTPDSLSLPMLSQHMHNANMRQNRAKL